MHRQEFHLIRARGGLLAFRNLSRSRHIHLILRILLWRRAYFLHPEYLPPSRNVDGCWIGSMRFIC
jgi:hypothetical protein